MEKYIEELIKINYDLSIAKDNKSSIGVINISNNIENLINKMKQENNSLQAIQDQSKLLLADVSKCNCQTPVKCDNCGKMVIKISTGEFCPSCYC